MSMKSRSTGFLGVRFAVDAVPIVDEEIRCCVVWECLDDLPQNQLYHRSNVDTHLERVNPRIEARKLSRMTKTS